MTSPGAVIGFVRGRHAYSRLIEAKGGWLYSHVTTLLPGGRDVLDSTWFLTDWLFHGSRHNGVQVRPLYYLDGEAIDWFKLCGTQKQVDVYHESLRSQVRKPYDFLGIRHFVFGTIPDRNFRDRSAWFCDELVMWAAERAGLLPRLFIPPYRIDPSGCALALQVAGALPIALNDIRRSRSIPFFDAHI